MITIENQHLLELLADILHDRTPKPVAPEEWPVIRDELHSQGVLTLPALNFNSLQLDSEGQALMRAQLNSNMHYFYEVLETQTNVVSELESGGIPVVVLKGSAAAMNYPVPELRMMGDVDVLVPKDKFEDAFHILNDKGYKPEYTLEHFHRHIGFIAENGIEVELHQYFAPDDSNEKYIKLNNFLSESLDKIDHVEINGYTTPVLPTVANGMVLLAHLNQHLRKGIGLRHIIDWMCFVEQHLDDDLWNIEFAPVAEQIGLVKLAKETTAMCQKYLGLSKSIEWCGMPDDITDKYIEYVLRQGNYAVKEDKSGRRAVGRILSFKNPFKALATAQEYGLKNWAALSEHPGLKPFAWMYQIHRWVRRGVENKVGIGEVKNAMNNLKNENALWDDLELIK